MVRWEMMFTEIISFVRLTLSPIYYELPLSDSVSNPIKTHIDGLGALLGHGVVGDPDRSAVIGGDWGGRLSVVQDDEKSAQWARFLPVVE